MNRITRTMLATAILGAATTAAQAQNYGMPLFTNPHYGTGVRVFLDLGMPGSEISTDSIDTKTIQGGVGFSLGPVGIQALVAGNFGELKNCSGSTPGIECASTSVSGAALAGLRLVGGGANPLALAVFGGVGTDFTGYEFATGISGPRTLSIPVGVSVGYKLGKLMIWGAPRYNRYQAIDCGGTCPDAVSEFRWAVGANLPVGPLGIRAAYDGGQYAGENVSFFAVGVSLGIGSHQ
jgi:hypothetical protein